MIKILYVHGYKGDKYGSSFQSLVKYAGAFGAKGYSLPPTSKVIVISSVSFLSARRTSWRTKDGSHAGEDR